MRIKKIRLEKFKGFDSLEMRFDGRDVSLYGDNATGKTTVADAITWLLFGKDSRGKADFEIKPLAADGRAASNQEHSVEGVFLDGPDENQEITLKKVYYEKWTRKRGRPSPGFTGHVTDHFVDGVPVKQKKYKKYKEAVAAIASEDMFRLLTTPGYFVGDMPWKERRKIVMEICGEESDAEIIAGRPELADLEKILPGGRSVDDHKKVVAAQREKINGELKKIPVRIDFVKRCMPSLPGTTLAAEQDRAEELATEIANFGLAAGPTGALKRGLTDKQAELSRITTARSTEIHKKISARQTELSVKDSALGRYPLEMEAETDGIARRMRDIGTAEREMSRLMGCYDAATEAVWNDTICPTCGTPWAQDRAAEMQNAFKLDRASRLKALRTEYSAQEEAKADLENQVVFRQGELQKLAARLADENGKADALAAEIATLFAAVGEKSPAMVVLEGEISALEQRIAAEDAGGSEEREKLTARKAEAEAELAAARQNIFLFGQVEAATARIDELLAEEKRLVSEFEALERELNLMDKFTRAKVEAVEGRVEKHFRVARFKMFNALINGGLEECCTVTVDGVPYGTGLNRGAEMAAGLDCIRTLSEHYKVWLPVIIDNAEAVTRLPKMDCQVIRLVVSEQDKVLRLSESNMAELDTTHTQHEPEP